MKTLLRLLLAVLVIAAIAFGVWYFVLNRPVDLQPRPAGTDGALAWAYGLALNPARTALAPDAVLVEAEASDVLPDGRLAANRGEWRLSFSSFSANGRILMTINYEGTVTTSAITPPGVIHPLGSPPGTFPNSIAIFSSTLGHGASGTRTVVNPVRCTYDGVAGAHVWKITFRVNDASETHQVRWDNVWLSVS
ncbi:MAG: hypothetical protein K8J31_28775 [Anaerolineae bacterium]|nr:hypothetical protein [Anaerolineae bacterium]